MGTVLSSLNLSDIKLTLRLQDKVQTFKQYQMKTLQEFLHGELVEQIAICNLITGLFKVANSRHHQKEPLHYYKSS